MFIGVVLMEIYVYECVLNAMSLEGLESTHGNAILYR